MTTHEPETPAVDTFVDAIMQSCGQIQLIVDHMMRNANPDAEPIPVVLKDLLTGVLGALPERHGIADVATAAQMLSAATELIAEEVYLVAPDRPRPRPRRRRG
jgi:hypothetical protein